MKLVKKYKIVGTQNPALLRRNWNDLHKQYNEDTTGLSFTKVQLNNKYNNYKKNLSKAKSKRQQSFKKTGKLHICNLLVFRECCVLWVFLYWNVVLEKMIYYEIHIRTCFFGNDWPSLDHYSLDIFFCKNYLQITMLICEVFVSFMNCVDVILQSTFFEKVEKYLLQDSHFKSFRDLYEYHECVS